MNDRSIIHAPDPEGRGTWLDAYMPENQVAHYQPPQQLINVAAIRGILFRQRWLVAAVVVAAAIAGLVMTLLATPMYQARATVTVQPSGAYIVEGQNLSEGLRGAQVYEYLATQIETINSRSLAEKVAAANNLGERSDFLGASIDEGRPPNLSDEEWIKQKETIAAAILHGSVNAQMPEESWIVPINFTSDDPAIAAEMANAYVDAFVELDTGSQISENEYAREYLQTEIQAVREKLRDAEQAANAYARNSGIIVQTTTGPDGEAGGVTLTASNLSSINARVAEARAKRIEAEQRWRSIENLPAAQLPEVQSNPVLQGLVTDRTAKQAELVDLRQRYNEDFPQIVNLRAQIETLDQQIERSSQNVKATVRNDYIVARNQEQALEQELNSLTGATLAEQDKQVEFSVLERESQVLRDQLQSMLARYNQLSSAANLKTGAVTKLDAARVPGAPFSPNLTRNMMLALVFGVAAAAGLAVLRETFDDRIRSLEEVEEKIGMPLLGHTPYVEERDIESEGTNRFSALMEAYSSIRSTIDFTMPRNRNVLQLTSSQAGEGKSTTAVILAELFASMGRKTLLVDSDLRRPSVASLLDIERPKVGLVEVLLGHTDLQSAVIKGVHENLEILPIGEVPPNPTEILASNHLREFIEKYREEYSLIIFDSCPVMGLADAPMLARLVDGTIFVLEANRVHFGQAKAAIRRIRRGGGNPIGAVLTKYRALEAGQAYDYQYGYYQYGKGA